MILIRKIILVLSVFIAFNASAQAPVPVNPPVIEDELFPVISPEKVGVAPENLEFLKNEISSWVEPGELTGGEVVIIKDGYSILHEAFGWFDREARIPMTLNQVYHTASMSKPFSTTLILKLHEQKALSIYDPVQKYILNFPDSTVKIYHLMNHTSGYSGWGPDGVNHENIGMFKSLEEWVIAWTDMGQTLPVGKHHYTNYNNAALMLVAEEATNKSAKTLTEELILKPYGLKNTYVYPLDPEINKNIPPLYRWTDNSGYEKIENFNNLNWPAYAGAFGIFSTAEDYALFMQYWINNGSYKGKELLSKETIHQSFSDENISYSEYENGSFYGYGWNYTKDNKDEEMPVFWHGGIMRSYAMAFPDHNLIAIYMTHSWKSRSHREAFIDRFYKSGIIDIQPAAGFVKYDPEKVNFLDLTSTDYDKYTGTYEGIIPGEDEIPIKVKLSYENGFLESRGTFPWNSIESYSKMGLINDHDAHQVVSTSGKVQWYNPELKITFVRDGDSVVGYNVYRNGILEATLTRIE